MVNGNVTGTINGCQVVVKGMTEQGHGHIYNTYGAGSDGRIIPGMIGYGTTKSAIRYFTDSLVKELKGKPVKVGSISPGMNVTENMLNQMRAVPPGNPPEKNGAGEHARRLCGNNDALDRGPHSWRINSPARPYNG